LENLKPCAKALAPAPQAQTQTLAIKMADDLRIVVML
jgi:hypothetical protein